MLGCAWVLAYVACPLIAQAQSPWPPLRKPGKPTAESWPPPKKSNWPPSPEAQAPQAQVRASDAQRAQTGAEAQRLRPVRPNRPWYAGGGTAPDAWGGVNWLAESKHDWAYGRARPPTMPETPQPEDSDRSPIAPPSFKTGPVTWTPVGKLATTPLLVKNQLALDKDLQVVFARALAGLEMRSEYVRVFANLETYGDYGTFTTPASGNFDFRLFEFWLELMADPFSLRVGRQELAIGSRRLISPSGAPNLGRAFDAIKVVGGFGRFEYEVFGAVKDGLQGLKDQPGGFDGLAGVYTRFAHSALFSLEPYFFFRHVELRLGETAAEDVPGRNIGNLGLRVRGKGENLQYDVEAMYQVGANAGQPHRAFAFLGNLDYAFDANWRPTLGGGVSFASGPSPDGSISGFDTFYPFNLPLYGAVSLFALTNVVETHARLRVSPFDPSFSITLEGLYFGLAESSAPWIDAFGVPVGANPSNENPWLGYEVDLIMQWVPQPYLYFNFVNGLFVPTGAREAFGKTAPSYSVFATAIVKFGDIPR